ncbi:MAG: LamG-like jellyroll fold domain-containing protein [Planctomycetota bacterium]
MLERTVLLLTAALSIMLAPSADADLSDGLVAYYPFNGNADDESGNGNDGTVHGATLTADRFGIPDSAYGFDGIDDWIDIGPYVKPPFPVTVATWLKCDTIQSVAVVRNDQVNSNSYRYGLAAWVHGSIGGYYFEGFSAPWNRVNKISYDSVVTTAAWHHLTVVFRGHRDILLYWDAVERAGYYDGTGSGMTYSSGNGALGYGDSASGSVRFDGEMDDVRVYNRVLSPDEIMELYLEGITIRDLQLNERQVSHLGPPFEIWRFSGIAGQQVRLKDVSVSEPEVLFDLRGPNGWVGFEGLGDDSDLITLLYTGDYTLKAWRRGIATDIVYSFRLEETAVIDVGAPPWQYDGQFVGSDQAQLFKMSVTESTPVRVVLDDSATDNANELYVKYGLPPTRSDYDYRYDILAAPDQEVLIPLATTGDWYTLVYAAAVATPSSYTLSAEATDIILTSVTPDHHGNSVEAVLSLKGAGFQETTVVELVDSGGGRYVADSVDLFTPGKLLATYTAARVPAGIYSVSVSNPGGGTDELAQAFEMTEGVGERLETDLVVPDRLGYHSVATIWIEYGNTGDVAMKAPLLILRARQNDREAAIMRLGDEVPPRGYWTDTMPEGFSHVIQFLATGATPGLLQPGESFKVPVQYAGWLKPWDFNYPPIIFELSVLDGDDDTEVIWDEHKEEMRPDYIDAELWEALFTNFKASAGVTWGDYVSMLTTNASYLARLGLEVTDVGELLGFEFAQAGGLHVIRHLAGSTDGYAAAPGLDISFSRAFPASLIGRYHLGSLGRGWSHNWEYLLEVAEDGTVTITGPGGSRRIFQPDVRGGYFAMEGDHGTLTGEGGGVFSLQEASGFLRVFRPDGKLDYAEDTNGNRITCTYSGDLLTRLERPSGQYLEITYGADDRIQTVTDPDGRTTTFSYDGTNEHLQSVSYFDGSVVSYSYSLGAGAVREHALTEILYPENRHQYFTYDTRGRLASAYRDGGAERVTFSYDEAGKVTVLDPYGNSVQLSLDHRGLLVELGDALGHTTGLTYDNEFNLTTVTDPSGFSYFYGYDAMGNLTQITDSRGLSGTTRFWYDGPFNRMTKLVDANDHATLYDYDDVAGNLESITYEDTSVERWTYAGGLPVTWTNRRGKTITYEYDDDGRLIAKTIPDPYGGRIDYTYDARGLLISATDSLGTTTLEYNTKDQLTKITYPGGRYLRYTYNDTGQRTWCVNQLGHWLQYHYDGVGRLESMTDESSTEIVHYYYDFAGRLERKVLGNGVYTAYQYDAAWQLTSLVNYKPDHTVLSSFVYAYDDRGRRTSMLTTEGLWTYAYDDLGQLTAWTAPDGRHVEYAYDALGNRITVTDDGTPTSYTTNEMNQYTQVGTTTYVFDPDGNLVQKIEPAGTTTYTYDNENRLVAVTSPDGNWGYTYDAFGERVRVDENGAAKYFVYDPVGYGDLVGAYDGASGTLSGSFDHGIGLLSLQNATGRGFFTYDATGNTTEVTDAAAASLNIYEYEPFGLCLPGLKTVENPFEFVGEYGVMAERLGIGFMRARFYDPVLGRFQTEDPIGLRAGDVSLYRYCANAPTDHIDPGGLKRWSWWKRLTTPLWWIRHGKWLGKYNSGGNIDTDVGRLGDLDVAPVDLADQASRLHDYLYHKGVKDAHGIAKLWLRRQVKITEALGYHETWWQKFWRWGFLHIPLPEPPDTAGETANSDTAASGDPNQKLGPGGRGPRNWVEWDSLLPYRIDFENDETATAPAQIVMIEDPLDANLDWRTFELTGVGFGDTWLTVPPNSQHYETVVPMTYNGTDFEVQIEAGIDLNTGEIYANFYSIDPDTGLPPSVDIGFLPPEDGTGRGQGYVTYVLRAKSGVRHGTVIRNVAYITFDFQETIATNQVDPHDPSKGTDPRKEAPITIDGPVKPGAGVR